MRNLIIKRSQLIIGLLLITGFAHGQLKDELAWQVIQASDKKRSIQLTDDLNRNGFKVELSLLQNGRLQLQISDPRLLAKVLKKRFFVELKNDADTLLTLNGLEIKSQLIGQYYLYQNPGSMRDSAEMANESKGKVTRSRLNKRRGTLTLVLLKDHRTTSLLTFIEKKNY